MRRHKKQRVRIEVMALAAFVVLLGGYIAYANISASGMFAAIDSTVTTAGGSLPNNIAPPANSPTNADQSGTDVCVNKLEKCVNGPPTETIPNCVKKVTGQSCPTAKCGTQQCHAPDSGQPGGLIVCGAVKDCPGQKGNIQDSKQTAANAAQQAANLAKQAGQGGQQGGGEKGGGSGGGSPQMPQPPQGGDKGNQQPNSQSGCQPGQTTNPTTGEACPQTSHGLASLAGKIGQFLSDPAGTLEQILGPQNNTNQTPEQILQNVQNTAQPAIDQFNAAHSNDQPAQQAYTQYAQTYSAATGQAPPSASQNMNIAQLEDSTGALNPNGDSLASLAAAQQNNLVPAYGGGFTSGASLEQRSPPWYQGMAQTILHWFGF